MLRNVSQWKRISRQLRGPTQFRPMLERLEERCVPSGFQQTNLVSDQPGVALVQDRSWSTLGNRTQRDQPFLVSNNGTAWRPFIKGQADSAVLEERPGGSIRTPSRRARYSTARRISRCLPPRHWSPVYLPSQTGQIFGWKADPGQTCAVAGASYTGLAIGSVGAANYLYATDFGHHTITVFDAQYHVTTLDGSFTDRNMPRAYAPFNIQNLNGKLYVTYAQIDHKSPSDESDHGAGFVDVFDTSGHLLQRMISGNHLNAPWGIAIAPSNFGN